MSDLSAAAGDVATAPLPWLAAVIPFPDLDPVALELGPLVIRWYALAYIAGLVLAWWIVRRIVTRRAIARLGADALEKASDTQLRRAAIMTRRDVDDLLFWCTLGVILGGRLGYVLFYKPAHFLAHPLEIFQLWSGGMSFHGGLIGVILAIILFCRARGINILSALDLAAGVTPIGLFLGRMANFVNGELWGRPTSVSWAMVFPADPSKQPRHPSQLYEAALEGLVLFLVLLFMRLRLNSLDRPGEIGGAFMFGYGLSRFLVEFVREPDSHLGLLWFDLSMGQLLSLPVIGVGLFGLWLGQRARRTPAQPEA